MKISLKEAFSSKSPSIFAFTHGSIKNMLTHKRIRIIQSFLLGFVGLLAACTPPTVPTQTSSLSLGRFSQQSVSQPGKLVKSGDSTYISGVPLVKQGKDNTCGQAVATMVLQFWGQDVDYQQVVNESNPLNLGTSFGALQGYLQSRGLYAQGYREGSLPLLLELVNRGRPVIALLDFGGLNWEHYVVVIGYNTRKNTLIFNDSRNGPNRELEAEEFVQRWANPSLVNLPIFGGPSYKYLMFDTGPRSAIEESK